ncbi:MAG: tetraacyldisaccharide 4'-kinase [Muribaculaceae bacterium]|nr:tetraacyldisaccharide 4'-kinase [Muribaculaceae bacterium]
MSSRSVFADLILLPLSKIYGGITWLRNKLFDWKVLPQREFSVPIIVVGNLAVGGTGKTPHTEYIVSELMHKYHIAVLSRGYKRKTRGFILATPYSKPTDIGDESYQMYEKFGHKVTVAVCEDRTQGINELIRLDPDINLIVLDDAFQHRYVKPTVAVIMTEFNRPLFRDHMLPYGRLREPLRGVHRADIVVATKCSGNMKDQEYSFFKRDLDLFPYQDLFFSRYVYQELVPLFPDRSASIPGLQWMTARDSVLAVAGIDNPRPFVKYLKSFMPKVRVNIFADHHAFTRKDMELLLKRYSTMTGHQRIVVTTEKDAVRLAASPYFPPELRAVTYYIPIKVEFSARGGDFIEAIEARIRNNSKIR